MNTSILSKLSLVSRAISKPFYCQLRDIQNIVISKPEDARKEQLLNIYSAFLYSQNIDNFNILEIINDKNKLQDHLDCLIGFIYSPQRQAITTKRTAALPIQKMFLQLAKDNNVTISRQSFSSKTINKYTQTCIDKYQVLPINQERLDYLNGWLVTSSRGGVMHVYLDMLYVKYGRVFTDKIHEVLKRYGLTQKINTLKTNLAKLTVLFESIVMLDKKGTVESFELLLSDRNVQTTFHKVYQILLVECICKGNSITAFNARFIHTIDIYQSTFINTKVYPSPLIPFIKPEVRKIKNPPSFSTGGGVNEAENMLWFSNIPLHIKDEKAITIIEERLDKIMSFLRDVLTKHFKELKERHNRNIRYLEEGSVKPRTGNIGGSGAGRLGFPIGSEYVANTVATFYHYGINGYTGVSYDGFLGYVANKDKLYQLLNLPTNSTLLTLTALLVMEHPKITPSWLQNFKLFDEHGKKCGYFQSGDQYIISSDKERRGRALAQQDVILNDFSKSIVDFIIDHTWVAREHLKSLGDSKWKYLLLTCSLVDASKPSRASQLYKNPEFLINTFQDKECVPANVKLTPKEVEAIAKIPLHRSIRRHRGLQIYLETRSQSAVADALGHKEMNPRLLNSYLPKPLMNFFIERVVRQFQKAIILKAMEGSPYLLDAVSMSYEEVEEFLKNHGLADMPDLNAKDFDSAQSKEKQSIFDSIIFTITVPLIQLLISIREVFDNDADKSNANFRDDLVEYWYNCATYILSRFEQGEFEGNDDIKDMYQEAQSNPLNPNVIKGAVSC